jgi:hypothetical protein
MGRGGLRLGPRGLPREWTHHEPACLSSASFLVPWLGFCTQTHYVKAERTNRPIPYHQASTSSNQCTTANGGGGCIAPGAVVYQAVTVRARVCMFARTMRFAARAVSYARARSFIATWNMHTSAALARLCALYIGGWARR